MSKVITWDDNKAQLEIIKRYENASLARKYYEHGWSYNQHMLYSIKTSRSMNSQVDSFYALPEIDSSNADMSVSYLMKNFKFLHAQMSANPPSVVMRPATSDQENSRRADAADKVVRWAMKQYKLQERVDQSSLITLAYGTGCLKTVWDASAGEVLDFDPLTGELDLEGDIDVSVPHIWNIRIDPDARSIDKIKWVIEDIYLDYDEACMRWPGPDSAKKLESARTNKGADSNTFSTNTKEEMTFNTVKLLEYWELGLPSNGYLGRYCITTEGGLVLESPRPNPFRFRAGGAVWEIENNNSLSDDEKQLRIKKLPERARLPYHFLTDIDVPNAVYGKSVVDYAAPLQENLSKLDSAQLDAIQAHSIARMIISEDSEITQMGNSNWDVTKVASMGSAPFFMKAPELMPEQSKTRQDLVQGLSDVMGVNESMFGQQSRETAGTAMQYATNQGNMIRRRLFNKYVLFVESLYSSILDLVRTNWTTSRTLHVLGKEHALEAVDIQGIDVDGGYDVVGDYGSSLSLDPTQRKQELLTMQPLLEKAGISTRRIVEMMKLSDLGASYDELQLADLRQSEIFEKMNSLVESGISPEEAYIAPKKYMDHENMIAYALRYFMTSEYQNLDPAVQALDEKHIDERAQLAAQMKSGTPAPGAPMPGAAPAAPGGPAPAPSPGGGAPSPTPPGIMQ